MLRLGTGRTALALLAGGASLCALVRPAGAITRDEVMIEARTQAFHPWRLTSANFSAPCASGYQNVFQIMGEGDYLGVAYDWGGFKSVFQFDQEIAAGEGAGSYNNYSGWPGTILDCTTGVDCSGYVSRCWDTGHNTTSGIPDITSTIDQGSVLAGDVFNQAGYHVVLFSHRLPTGEPVFYEATPPWTVWSKVSSWSYLGQYVPRRYSGITGADAGDPEGTPTRPVQVPSLPGAMYTDARDTALSPSSALDGCGVAPTTAEGGPEVVYQIEITQPGLLRATVAGDVAGSVDNDVHLYTSMNTADCIARDNAELLEPVDCGTYYVVVDTFGSDSQNAGPYNLEIELQSPSGTCGAGPPSYDFIGTIGAPCWCSGGQCSYCDQTVAPLCHITEGNLSDGTGFCTKACVAHDECIEPPGATSPEVCCGAIDDSGALYCLSGESCAGVGGGGTGGGGVGNGGTGAGSGVFTLGSPRDDRDNGADITRCATAATGPRRDDGPPRWLLLGLLAPVGAAARRRRRRPQ